MVRHLVSLFLACVSIVLFSRQMFLLFIFSLIVGLMLII